MSNDTLTIGALAVWLKSTIKSFEKLRDETFSEGTVVVASGYGFGIVPVRQPVSTPIGTLMVKAEVSHHWIPISELAISNIPEDWPWWVKEQKGLTDDE